MNFGLGAHIDAAGRLVHDDDLRLDRKLLGDGDLLLIAARQRRHLLGNPGHLDAQARCQRDRLRSLDAPINEPAARDFLQVERRDILRDRKLEEHA
ncbi:hypothetical protein D9M68_1001960 [compost metagenome]